MISLHGENNIVVKVKMINNEVINVGINLGKSVLDLKEEIRRKINMPIVNQKLIFQGKVLKDNDGLSVYKLENDDVIHLVRVDPRNENHLENEERNNSNTPTLLEYLALLSMMNNGINTNLMQIRNQNNNNNNPLINSMNNYGNNNNNNNNNNYNIFRINRNLEDTLISDSFANLLKPSNFNMYNSIENIIQNINNINILISSKNDLKEVKTKLYKISNSLGKSHINFKVGQWVDVYDTFQTWSEAQIIEINENNNKGLFHFIGWSNELNEWINLDSPRICLYRTHTIQSPYSRFFSPFPNKKDDSSNISINNIGINDVFHKMNHLVSFVDLFKCDLENILNINFEKFKKKFYVSIMQLYPLMDRIGRLFLDYSMLLMNLSFKFFNENPDLFRENIIDNNVSNNLNDNDALLKERVLQYEKFTQIPAMRNNGEIAQSYRLLNSNSILSNNNNINVRRTGGANFQQQLRAMNNNNNINNNINNNNEINTSSNNNNRNRNEQNWNIIRNFVNSDNYPFRNSNNNNMSIEYLNEVRILPSLNVRNKFNENKTKVIKQNTFSIIHYNKFKTRTFETFTQTFPIYSDCKISNTFILEFKTNKKIINSQPKNNNNNLRSSQNIKTSKFMIDAGKTQRQTNKFETSKNSNTQNSKNGKYKLKKINK